jgi:hypothetical protein
MNLVVSRIALLDIEEGFEPVLPLEAILTG